MMNEDRDTPTWKWLAVIMAVVALSAVLFAGYKAYTREIGVVDQSAPPNITGRPLNLSEESKQELVAFMDKEKLIIAISTVEVNLVKNNRRTTFFNSENPKVQELWDDYLTRRAKSVPAFSSSAPQSQNIRTANLINGNYDCRKFTDTVGFQYYPGVNQYAPWVCSISVPVAFDGSGDFVGFISFYMQEEPSDSERKRLAKDAVILSTNIFNRDVATK